MKINFKQFSRGLKLLGAIKDTQMMVESFSLTTEDGYLWGRTMSRSANLAIQVLMARDVNETIKGSYNAKTVKAAVVPTKDPNFDMFMNKDNTQLLIRSKISVDLRVFSSARPHREPGFLRTGNFIKEIQCPFTSSDLDLFNDYLNFITGVAGYHPFVYVKAQALATDNNILRRSTKDFELGHLLGLDASLLKLFESCGENYKLGIYDFAFKIESIPPPLEGGSEKVGERFTIVFLRPLNTHNNYYDSMQALCNQDLPLDSVRFDRGTMISALDDLKKMMTPTNQSLRLDFKENCIRVLNDHAKGEASISFTCSSPDFKYKYVSFDKFASLLSRGSEVMEIKTGTLPYSRELSEYLHIFNNDEHVLIAPGEG